MVLQKRLDYGFNGYQVPPTPRAARSTRRRGTLGKRVESNQMCAFDLLATVAGKLLLDGEGSSSVKKEQEQEHQDNHPSKLKPNDSCPKEHLLPQNDSCSGVASVITAADCDEKLVKLEEENKKMIKIEVPNTETNEMPPGVKFPLEDHHVSCSSFRDDVKLVVRDDDENSSGCTHPRTSNKAYRPSPRVGNRRIRKLFRSKYWKATPKLNGEERLNCDAEMKPIHSNRKNCNKRVRSQRDFPLKKRKLYNNHSSLSNSDGGTTSDAISSSPRKGLNGDASGLGSTMHGVCGTSASAAYTSFQSRDSNVKLKIKSFRVPELFIEIPETATVGSLKRTVMEAVTAILGGGLRVGILLQGKKIRDDNRTLLQTGISHENKLDALGFTLEPQPTPSQPQQSLCSGDGPLLLSCEEPKPLSRYPPTDEVHNLVETGKLDGSVDPIVMNFKDFVESDHDSAPSPPEMSIDKGGAAADLRALVSARGINAEALAVVPMRKYKRSDMVQRRIRRPFSVTEVEALVQAVEKLGTGRWRDVKLRAFDNAKHRTYVDLKDKWKTLVHTARISPQQRRGEPVPQELLDRVLAAHAYWTQQQQLKHDPDSPPHRLLL